MFLFTVNIFTHMLKARHTYESVSGYALPPFIIYPRKRIADKLKVGAVPGTAFH